MVCLVGYVVLEFFNNKTILTESIDSISGFGKFMKNLTVVFIVLTMIGMILNLSINYDKISGNKMPNSYYNFSMLINLFLSIQISDGGSSVILPKKLTTLNGLTLIVFVAEFWSMNATLVPLAVTN